MKNNKNLSLLTAIENDIVTFTFKKLNGDARIAAGTRNINLIPATHHPKGTGRSPAPGILTFFDWTRQQWRSCRESSIFGYWFIANKDLLYRINRYEELGLDDPYDFGNSVDDIDDFGNAYESDLI